MPFRFAPQVILGLIALTVVAFWPSYFSVLGTSPWGFHFHGLTATAWLLLLALQSWTVQSRRFALHRAWGTASLVLFPVFLCGGVAVVWSMAAATAGGNPFYAVNGARVAVMDIPSVVLLGYLFYKALADRRSVQLHARWLLSTALPLLPPIIGRILNTHVPSLVIHGPQDFGLFAWGVRWASVVAVLIAASLYATAPKYGRPFLVTAMALAGQAIAFETLGTLHAWDTAFRALTTFPIASLLLATVIAGAAIDWFGWQAGAWPARRAVNNG